MVASIYSHERRTDEDRCDYHFHASQLLDIGFSRGVTYALQWREWFEGYGPKPVESQARRSEHVYAYKHFARKMKKKSR